MGRSECAGTILLSFSTDEPSQVFVTGYYVGESTDISTQETTPMQDGPTTPPQSDQRQAKPQINRRMKTSDRITGDGPKVTETSVVGVRYEIKTSGGVVIDNNRRSNTKNKELVSTSFKACVSRFQHPR